MALEVFVGIYSSETTKPVPLIYLLGGSFFDKIIKINKRCMKTSRKI